MTDEHDFISAYVDGEATPEEVARVESDPDLVSQADTMRALADEVGRVPLPTGEVRAAQLAAALDAFSATNSAASTTSSHQATPDDGTATSSGSVVSLDQRRARAGDTRSGSGFPTWLGAAAALLLVVGGLGVVLSGGGGSDNSDAATAAFGETDESTEADAESAVDDDAVADAAASQMVEEGATEEADRFADEAMEDDAAEDAMEDSDDADESEATDLTDPTASTAAVSPATTAPGLFPEEIEQARVALAEPPDEDLRAELADGDLLPASWSSCGEDVAEATATEVVGMVPLAIDGQPHELLVLEGVSGRKLVVVDGGCQSVG